MAEGVLALLKSLPFAWAVSRVKVSESVKVRVVAAKEIPLIRNRQEGT